MQYDLAGQKLQTKRLRARYASLSQRPETHAAELEEIHHEMRRSQGLQKLIEARDFFHYLTHDDVAEWMTELEFADQTN